MPSSTTSSTPSNEGVLGREHLLVRINIHHKVARWVRDHSPRQVAAPRCHDFHVRESGRKGGFLFSAASHGIDERRKVRHADAIYYGNRTPETLHHLGAEIAELGSFSLGLRGAARSGAGPRRLAPVWRHADRAWAHPHPAPGGLLIRRVAGTPG